MTTRRVGPLHVHDAGWPSRTHPEMRWGKGWVYVRHWVIGTRRGLERWDRGWNDGEGR